MAKRKVGGRPKSSDAAGVVVGVRCTAKERAAWQAAADAEKRPLAQWMRVRLNATPALRAGARDALEFFAVCDDENANAVAAKLRTGLGG